LNHIPVSRNCNIYQHTCSLFIIAYYNVWLVIVLLLLLLSLLLYWKEYIAKYPCKIIHIIMCIVIHSSYCILNFMLPASRPVPSKVACMTKMAQQTHTEICS
jgi:MFS superfamily sulfate permease-like transporter